MTLSEFAGSAVPVGTIAAYLAAEYRFWGDRALVLTVGQASGALAALFRDLGVSSAAVITAWNPRGLIRSETENHAAQARLIERLDTLGFAQAPGHGSDPDPAGAWTPEDSRLVLGIDHDAAVRLGHDLGQNAIVWSGADALPKLLILR